MEGLVRLLATDSPFVVSFSPDNQKVLFKSLGARDFQLLVRAHPGGTLIASDRSDDSQISNHWRSDSGAIAFLSDQDGDEKYRLYLLDLASKHRLSLDAPATFSTLMRWSPRGSQLAYVQVERGRVRRLLLLDTANHGEVPRVLATGLAPKASFAWSPAGDRLALVHATSPGTIVVLDPKTEVRLEVEIAAGGEVRSLSWSPDGKHLLATVRIAAAEHLALAEVSLETKRAKRLPPVDGEISGVRYLPKGDGLAYHLSRDGETQVYLCDRTGAQPRRIGPPDGSSGISSFSSDGNSAVLSHAGLDRPPELLDIQLQTAQSTVIQPSAKPFGSPVLIQKPIAIPSSGGLVLPSYLASASRQPGRRPAALIRIHGGPNGQFSRTWDASVQLLADAGYDVISLNYRGSTGYGARFESYAGDYEGQVSDVIAARNYAVIQLGVPPKRVVLWGHSYGALLAAAASARDPEGFGALVLLSMVPAHRAPSASPQTPTRVLAFEGQQDVIQSPETAREELQSMLGKTALTRRGDRWTVFDKEGHSFHRLQSWAQVYHQVLAILPQLGE